MDTHLLAITGFVDGSRDCKPDAAKKKKKQNMAKAQKKKLPKVLSQKPQKKKLKKQKARSL